MYVTAPGRRSQTGTPLGHAAPLGLARAVHQVFGPGGPFGNDDHIYYPDLMRSYGTTCPPDAFEGRRNSFTDMLTAVLPRLRPYADGFDLAVLAAATPDSQPGFPMCHLSNLVPDAGLAFAVLDQGLVTAFTALQVLANRSRRDGAGRLLLVVVDQSVLLHDLPVPQRLRVARDAVVVLAFDPVADGGRLYPPSSAPTVSRTPQAALAEALAEQKPQVLVTGAGLAGRLPTVPDDTLVLPAPLGQPVTGVWQEVAARLPQWQVDGARVLIADHDADQERLATCLLDVPAGGKG
ncbi:hypothetical protein GCM10009541_09320 [Micromonospora gifhornensis]|uniref:Uncharacterized protein n=1 Tax=Micromonospora gifhornensis TaxID=84594 RepID=A0ABQ4IBB2_9ACTN|nr:hypothetical protein [Micromonospora gifhornensis]GIJ15184.1 hypothetical protein Vgi01_18680 [Micromonospora gifhornensis]